MQTFISNSANDTYSIAASLAQRLKTGGVVALMGDLGAGKTTFTQGFAKHLGIEKIISPTFVLIKQYTILNTAQILFHLDLYRLEHGFEHLGLTDLFANKNSIILIEWAEKIIDKLPQNTVKVRFEKTGDSARKITISE